MGIVRSVADGGVWAAPQMADNELRLRFLNMNDSWHRWVPRDSGQLAQPATKVRHQCVLYNGVQRLY